MKLPDIIHKKITKNPSLVLGLSFIILILTGALLLSLPFASADGKSLNFVDALFSATSASCVTGLIVRNTAEAWSIFGKVVIITLIQIGGLGTMTMVAWVSIFIGKRIGLSERMFIKEQWSAESLTGLIRLMRFATLFTLIVEGLGALLLSFRLIPMYGIKKGLAFSVFHSISAFCNAGFDLFGDSLVSFQDDYFVTLIIAALIILGGLGFIVYVDLLNYPKKRRTRRQTKLVLSTTVILLIGGMILFYFFESTNSSTIGSMPMPQKVLASFFQSVTFRTAGFNSIDMGSMRDTTVFFSFLFMFIGGSPGSTAGGLKTTTFAIVMSSAFSTLKGQEDTVLFKRRVEEEIVRKAFSLFVIAIALVFVVAAFIVAFENGVFQFIDILFETISAFGTVGVTRGITGNLSSYSKLALSFTMYIGRIGPTTFAMGLFHDDHKKKYRYAEGKYIVG
ncbi:potassium uptake protein, TrkH family [Aedoeadaptatus nemausensis]|uniref:Potassium uptake protein, TrkH family n=1 Tax=Aedoeadaptatus nemausensis TaxID=2582829 RepID=A0A6V6XZ71_9FIRM|nr:TrkH family potassium uptake protein [Peptoniphilus nemausensis]CAC9924705.1 potassium uptake protein, TrkH family [Peptoniphilus nemausensis]